nr:hypothetical protein [Nocardia albiluteola]
MTAELTDLLFVSTVYDNVGTRGGLGLPEHAVHRFGRFEMLTGCSHMVSGRIGVIATEGEPIQIGIHMRPYISELGRKQAR